MNFAGPFIPGAAALRLRKAAGRDISLPMLLRRLMSVLAALTIVIVVGAFASGSAHAHNGHSHGASVLVKFDADISPSDEIALAVAEIGALADISRGDVEPLGTAGLAENSAPASKSAPAGSGIPPCDGHCCAVGGTSCCGYMPASLELETRVSVMDLGSGEPGDSILDGLEPEFFLRPPKSFA